MLHKGYLVETGTTEEIFNDPRHPYTQSLLSAVPIPNPHVEKKRRLITYDGGAAHYENAALLSISDTHFVLES